MKKTFEFQSASNPKKKYIVVYDEETGIPESCNCPAFLFRNKFKQFCKHMRAFKITGNPGKKTI